jgi:hypothetical protein
METPNCPVCGNVMIYNADGLQRNPKAPTFKCSSEGCKFQKNKTTGEWEPSDYKTGIWANQPSTAPRPTPTKTAQMTGVIDYKSDKIAQAQASKEYGIKVAGAKSIAGNIVAAMIHSGELKATDWRIKFDEIYKYVYNYQPGLKTEPQPGEEIPF